MPAPSPNRSAATKLLLLVLLVSIALSAIALRPLLRRPVMPPRRDLPPRIAALSPALAVTLRDLHRADSIVARHSYDLVLDKFLPVGLDRDVDYEQLLSVKPTHILLQLQSNKVPDRLLQLSVANNWRIIDFPLLALDDIKTTTTRLATLFAPGADVPLLKEMDRAWSKRPNIFTGRVLLLAGLDPPSALGPGSWHHQLLEHIGGTPAITEGNPWITLDAEDVLHMKPDAIILILPRDRDADPASPPTADDVRRMIGRLGTLDIPAVAASRFALIDDPLAHTPSTAMIHLADEMAAILERWNRKHSNQPPAAK